MSEQDSSSSEKNIFVGFVLLSKNSWNKAQFIADMKADWNISLNENEDKADDTLVADVDNMSIAIGLMPSPVPNGEAEHYAAANYMWEEAVEVTQTHKAHNLVAILGEEENPIVKGKLFVKVVCALLKQDNALAVYADGIVQKPEIYIEFAEIMKEEDSEFELPIMNFVWFGFHNDGTTGGVYTFGLNKFGKDEIEMYTDVNNADFEEMFDFLVDIANYVIESDVTLQDGETIGISEEHKCLITKNAGIALPGETLKISIEAV